MIVRAVLAFDFAGACGVILRSEDKCDDSIVRFRFSWASDWWNASDGAMFFTCHLFFLSLFSCQDSPISKCRVPWKSTQLSLIFAGIERTRERGSPPIVYFYFHGHSQL